MKFLNCDICVLHEDTEGSQRLGGSCQMPFSIQLRFDKESEASLLSLSRKLNTLGIADPHTSHSSVPHIALAVFPDLSQAVIEQVLRDHDLEKFDLNLSSIGTFPGKENVIFLSPKPTPILLRVQEEVANLISKAADNELYYRENVWVPHCTVGIDIPDARFGEAFHLLKDSFRPLTVSVESICLTMFRPSVVLYSKELLGVG